MIGRALGYTVSAYHARGVLVEECVSSFPSVTPVQGAKPAASGDGIPAAPDHGPDDGPRGGFFDDSGDVPW